MIISFSGKSEHTLDTKNRLSIPAIYRRWQQDDSDYTFVVTKGPDPCLIAHPSVEWDIIAKKLLSNLSQFNTRHTAYVRAYCSEASRLKCDKQGRILIPQPLLDYARITKEVTIIGMINRLELWNSAQYRQHEPSHLSPDDEFFKGLDELIQ